MMIFLFQVYAEEYNLKIILPEGAKDFNFNIPIDFDETKTD